MWKTNCKSFWLCELIYVQLFPIQITHLCDFAYWLIFRDLTVEEIREREERFEYPPRLQIKCKQVDASKPLYSSFKISKRSKNEETPIAEFILDKTVAGMYMYVCVYVAMYI